MAWYWWLTFSLLLVGTLVGGFLLLRWLWRKAVLLGGELARAGEAAQRLTARADELAAAARERHPVPPPALARRPGEIRAELAAVRAARQARTDMRRARQRQTWERWSEHWR